MTSVEAKTIASESREEVFSEGSLFSKSSWDAMLVGLCLLEIGLTVYSVSEASARTVFFGLVLAPVLVFLNVTNYQCIAHNFIHNPFFRGKLTNRIFSVVNTLALGVPQSLYRVHHLNHHRYNSDAIDPKSGKTGDLSSIYRYGKNGNPESIWSYAILGPIRADFMALYRGAVKQNLAGLVLVELAALVCFWIALALFDWTAFLYLYLPCWALGQAASYAENYLEHYGADPSDRKTDSVSCYGALYNFIWFNNGYHQEHHFQPYVHWMRLPSARPLMFPESQRRVVSGAHWFNFRKKPIQEPLWKP